MALIVSNFIFNEKNNNEIVEKLDDELKQDSLNNSIFEENFKNIYNSDNNFHQAINDNN